jgi:hypothetical protein
MEQFDPNKLSTAQLVDHYLNQILTGIIGLITVIILPLLANWIGSRIKGALGLDRKHDVRDDTPSRSSPSDAASGVQDKKTI